MARRGRLAEALRNYRAAAGLQESSDCARRQRLAAVLATEGEPRAAGGLLSSLACVLTRLVLWPC